MIASVAVIYTTFKMTYSERIKEFGMLSSIGMSKRQRKKVINKEAFILGCIGIVIGFLIGIGLSEILIKLLDNLIRNTKDTMYMLLTVDPNTRLYMKVPILVLLLTILVVYIIIFISNKMVIRKINQIALIEAIKNAGSIKIKPKNVKAPQIIEKIFKEEGIIAYKNIRRDKTKYKTIVISLLVSIILFLNVNGILNTFYFNKSYLGGNNQYNDYRISITEEKELDTIINYLKENKLINKYYAISSANTEFKDLTENIMSEELKNMLDKGVFEEGKEDVYTSYKNGKLRVSISKIFFYRRSL